MANKILEIKNLKKCFHSDTDSIVALDGINLDVYENEFISIVGPSGCGKSTILSILTGIYKKSDGEFKLKDDVTIGYMLQRDSLFSWRSVLDNCLVGLEVTGQLTDENKEYVISLLKTYGLYEFMDKYPDSLSGGMRQRVLRILYTHK